VIVAPALIIRRWPVIALAAAAVLALLYAPFVWKGATEFAGLEVFSRWWEFNSLGFALAKAAFGDGLARPLTLVLGVALGASLMLYWRLREPDTFPPADQWLIALLFFAPVINPWYLLWAVPWACLRPNELTWSILPAVSVSYLTVGVLGVEGPGFFDHPAWVRPFEVLLAVTVYLGLRARPRLFTPRAPWNAAIGRQTEQRKV
jgi:alpha-1,6-mannosyltransferase